MFSDNQNERLRLHNEALSRALSEQREAAAKWQADFLTSITSTLGAFNISQERLLEQNIRAVQTSLTEAQDDRSRSSNAKGKDINQLENDAARCQSDLRGKAKQIDEGVKSQIMVRPFQFQS